MPWLDRDRHNAHASARGIRSAKAIVEQINAPHVTLGIDCKVRACLHQLLHCLVSLNFKLANNNNIHKANLARDLLRKPGHDHVDSKYCLVYKLGVRSTH